jgi:uncharacterized HAD superfamily protein
MKYVIDIDGTICDQQRSGEYDRAKPYKDRIEKINELYNDNTIIYYTARGSATNKDYFDMTINQLSEWGCKYHELITRKLSYDVWIDDKAHNADDWFKK